MTNDGAAAAGDEGENGAAAGADGNGALDVLVNDEDAVATVGKMKALRLGWTMGRVTPRRRRMSKALLLRWGLMAALLLRCRKDEKRRARVVKSMAAGHGRGAVGGVAS